MSTKILFLLHIPPPIHGSSIIGRIIKDSELINEAFECKFINLSTSSSTSKIGIFNLKKVVIYLDIIYQIISSRLFERYDIVYIAPSVSDWGFIKDFILVIIIKSLNRKVVYHLHNKGVSKQDNLLYKLMFKYFFRNVKIILLSELLFHDLIKYVDRKNVFICPNGIEEVPLLEEELKKKNSNSIPNILFLSNLITSKGVFDVIEACAILKKKGIKFKVKFIGAEVEVSKSMFQFILSKYNLLDEIEYLGVKVGIDKHLQLLLADVFVFPTYYDKECFPLVILEAMQYGLPIISTKEGGIPDLVKEEVNGLIVNRKSPNEISSKLEVLLGDKEKMKRFSKQSRNIFLNKYTKDIFEERLVKILSLL